MRIQVGYEVRHRNAISLIEIDDLSFQTRPQRTIIIRERHSIKWGYTVSVFSLHIKQREPSVLKSHGMPLLRHKLPMSLIWI